MKTFTIQLDDPPKGLYYPGTTISGVVIAENDEEPKAYRAIEVVLNGEAYAKWSETRGTGESRQSFLYKWNEKLIYNRVTLWDKDRDADGGMYPVGSNSYKFSFELEAPKLPPTYIGMLATQWKLLYTKREH